ncbi:MAG: hypothetical protein WCY29_11225 [Novosphingobium sp.]
MKHPICAALLAASAFGLSGCATDGYGYGYGGGSYYGNAYWGWYDDYYYPGTGYYIYDRGGQRHRWNDSHRRYWEGRRGSRRGSANWSGYQRDGQRPGIAPPSASQHRDRRHDDRRGDRRRDRRN